MSTIDIAYGAQTDNIQIEVPVLSIIELHLKQIEVIKGFLNGTDSDSWLIEAEKHG